MNPPLNPFVVRRPSGLINNDFIPQQNILKTFQEEEQRFFKRRSKVEALKKDNAHTELQLPLTLAQLISLFPVYGIREASPSNITFRWRSLKIVYCFVIMFFEVAFCVLIFMKFSKDGMNYSSFGNILFYVGSAFISCIFIKLAICWKTFIGEWVTVQESMNDFEPLSVRRTVKVITIWLLLSSLSEHLLANSETIYNIRDKEGDTLRMFLEGRHMQVFSVFSYSPYLGLIASFVNLIITMIWNFTDIFLTTISLALSKMFKQFSLDLELTSRTISNEASLSYWRKRREIYSRLSLLTKLVDEKVSFLVLISFGINVYYVCIQLLHTLKPMESLMQVIYFAGSFGHLFCRTLAFSFAASSIYENSKKPLSIIFSVPSEQFNIEVQRLQMQVSSETIALTGCNFFSVTRSLMLTIAGTIVTYEIVLWQFSSLDSPTPPRNSTEH